MVRVYLYYIKPVPFIIVMNKALLYQECVQKVELKLNELQSQRIDIEASMHLETKSSVGDKYETGRAMLHQELDKIGAQQTHFASIYKLFQQINPEESITSVKNGALIKTSKGMFWIVASLGEVVFDGVRVFVMSGAAPLAQAFKGKSAGDQVLFNKMEYVIKSIV